MKTESSSGTRSLLAGFLLIISLLLALAGVGLHYLKSMNQTITRIVEGNNERTHLATEMYISARERALQLYAILQEVDPFDRDALVPRFHELGGVFRGAREKLLSMPLEPLERELLKQQAEHTSRGSLAQDMVLDLALTDRNEAAVEVLLKQALPAQNQATIRLRQLLDEQIKNGHDAVNKARGQYQWARNLMLASALAATLLAVLIAVVVIRRQSRLLVRLQVREREAVLLLDNIPVPVWFKDMDGRIVRCNGAFARIAGFSEAELVGKQEADIWGQTEGLKSEQNDRKALDSGEAQRQDRRLKSRAGIEGHYIIARTPIADDVAHANVNGVWRGVLCVANDLTSLERMNELLEVTNLELQAQKTALDEHAIVSITGLDGRITYANQKFCDITDYTLDELLGQTHSMVNSGLHPPEFFAEMGRTIASGKVWHGEIRNRRRDGSFYWVNSTIVPLLDMQGHPSQFIAIRTDITARKRMEESLQDINAELQLRVDERTQALTEAKRQLETDIEERNRAQVLLKQQYQQLAGLHHELQDAQGQLLQSEKLASIGQLAAGVAHEINNPIGFVHSNLGTLENYIRDLFRIIEAYETCGAAPHPDVVQLKQQLDLPYLKEDIPALMTESRDGITRVRKIVQDLKDFSRLDSSPDWQYANLHQGLDSTLNIAQNEIKYCAEVVKQYGDIPEIECLPSQLNQVFMNLLVNAAHAMEGARGTITVRTARDGDEVWVEVADTGKGIPEELCSRIFDPFFTTKAVGKGTGLGLSLAYGIVQKHNGRIEVQSEVGTGTTFRVTLPVKHQAAVNIE